MKIRMILILLPVFISVSGCAQKIYLGGDLSYVNEIEKCGATFRENGEKVDPYELFSRKGANLVRLRLWHTPKTPFSDLKDVSMSIKRAKAQKMEVLLDFHYSDTWADPARQDIPKAWANISDLRILGDSVYNYTYRTLSNLYLLRLLPDMVQIGNETNSEILQPEGKPKDSIDWKRNAFLLSHGIAAVRAFSKEKGKEIPVMLHIAQPENALKWFAAARENNVTDYDWIGISYYPLWSEYKFDRLPIAIKSLIQTYKKKLMIVETSYPYTLNDVDKAGNVLGEKALLPEYPATPEGQRRYMINLTKVALGAGASGIVYWEPAWVTSNCTTQWGQGSHWDNATFFDAAKANEALPAFDFFNIKNYQK